MQHCLRLVRVVCELQLPKLSNARFSRPWKAEMSAQEVFNALSASRRPFCCQKYVKKVMFWRCLPTHSPFQRLPWRDRPLDRQQDTECSAGCANLPGDGGTAHIWPACGCASQSSLWIQNSRQSSSYHDWQCLQLREVFWVSMGSQWLLLLHSKLSD